MNFFSSYMRIRTTSACSRGNPVECLMDLIHVFPANHPAFRCRRRLFSRPQCIDGPSLHGLPAFHDDRFIVSDAKKPALEGLFAGRMSAFDRFGERDLQDVRRRIMIVQNADQESTQLLRMFDEECGDDAGVHLLFVGFVQGGLGGEECGVRRRERMAGGIRKEMRLS